MQLTVREAARYLEVSEKTVYRWIRQEKIPHHFVAGQHRFNHTELLEWASERKHKISTSAYRREDGDAPVPGVAQLLEAGGILHRLPGGDKPSALRSMVDALRLPARVDRESLLQVLLSRERLGSTAVGRGIAIPHVRHPIVMAVTVPVMALFFLDAPIDFGAADGRPVGALIWLVSPSVHLHTYLLSKIAALIRDPGFMSALERQAPAEEILNAARRAEAPPGEEPPGASKAKARG